MSEMMNNASISENQDAVDRGSELVANLSPEMFEEMEAKARERAAAIRAVEAQDNDSMSESDLIAMLDETEIDDKTTSPSDEPTPNKGWGSETGPNPLS